MTSRSALLFAAAAALVACDGDHTIGSTDSDLTKCCYEVSSGHKVKSCTNQGTCYCSPELCGSGSACKTRTDCPQLGVPCQMCADGSTACPSVDCVSGQCVASIASCPSPACTSDSGCAVPLSCQRCADGSCAGYTAQCVNGKCVTTPPSCPSQCTTAPPMPVDGGATSGSGCAVPAICKACSDGSTSCAQARCDNGQCTTYFPDCPTTGTPCTSDSQCPQSLAPCQRCSDGSSACPHAWCANGTCQMTFESCPPSTCATDADCQTDISEPCKTCPNGTSTCAVQACVSGQCQTTFPACP